MDVVERLQTIAAVLTPDKDFRQRLVGDMAVYLVQAKPVAANGSRADGPQVVETTDVTFDVQRRDADRDLVQPLCAALPARQREVFQLLLAGAGVREAGRRLGISHVAVIKHREKILRHAHKFLTQAAPANSFAASGDPALPAQTEQS